MLRSRWLVMTITTSAIVLAGMPATTLAADDSTVTYGAFDRGTYTRYDYQDGHVTYMSDPDSRYFPTGRWEFQGFTDPMSEDDRSFFAFDVGPSDQAVTKAVLRISVPGSSYVSKDDTETFALVDVTSPVDQLIAGGEEGTSGLDAIWQDLGEGHQYASRSFSAADDGTTLSITLDGTATSMLQTGGRIAFGGHLTTLSSGVDQVEQIFQLSGNAAVSLVLTYAPPPPPPTSSQPDAWISNGSAVAGYGVVNGTGSGQKVTKSVQRGSSTTFLITITNSGGRRERYTIRGDGSTTKYKVRYKVGTTDVTSKVTAGTYQTAKVTGGSSVEIKLTVTVLSAATPGSSVARKVTASSTGAPDRKDRVQAIVKRK